MATVLPALSASGTLRQACIGTSPGAILFTAGHTSFSLIFRIPAIERDFLQGSNTAATATTSEETGRGAKPQ